MTFKFVDYNNELYNFRGINHDMIIAIHYYSAVQTNYLNKSIINPEYNMNFIDYNYNKPLNNDDDDDGYLDVEDAFPYNSEEWKDNDMDGIGDNQDDDDDNDDWKDHHRATRRSQPETCARNHCIRQFDESPEYRAQSSQWILNGRFGTTVGFPFSFS